MRNWKEKPTALKLPSPPERGRGGKEELMYSQLVKFLQSVPPLILPLHQNRYAPGSSAAKKSKGTAPWRRCWGAEGLLPGSSSRHLPRGTGI